MNPLNLLLIALFPAVVIVAALRDATTMTIPNWLCLTGLVAFLPVALIAHMPMGALGACLGVGVICLIAGMAMFAVRWIGGGDAKLLAVCGLWMGWPLLMSFLFWTALAGGGLALSLMAARKLVAPRSPHPEETSTMSWLARLLQPNGDIPYGVAIAIGAMVAYPAAPVFQLLHGSGLH